MTKGYNIENQCNANKNFFKCVKVYNYHSINEIVNAVSGTFEVTGTTDHLVGFWKIKKLKQ